MSTISLSDLRLGSKSDCGTWRINKHRCNEVPVYCKLFAALANGSLYHCVQGLPRPICFSILECNSLIASGVRWLSNERETGLWILPLNQCRLWQLHRLECTYYVNWTYYFFGKRQSYRMTIRQIFSEWELYRFFVQRAAVFLQKDHTNCIAYQLYRVVFVENGNRRQWQLDKLVCV